MKFVVEALGLNAGGGVPCGVNLLSKLPAHVGHRFVLLIPDLAEYGQIEGANLRVVRRAVPRSLLARHMFLSRSVPEICRQEQADALLGLGNFIPRRLHCPAVVMLHNPYIIYRELVAEGRDTLRNRLIDAYGRYHYRHLPAGVCVVVQTEIMKGRLYARFGINPARVAVIPSGLVIPETDVNGGDRSGPLSGVSRPFTFLCLSRYYAHKNIEILPAAIARLPRYTKKAVQCLITISPDQHPNAAAFLRTLSCGGPASRLINIGPVSRDKIGALYRSADAYILPTLLETYCYPYDEALHFGLPVLTSDRDFARSRLGDAAVYLDPLDADSVARAMAAIMEDENLRSRLVERGRHIVQQIPSWDEVAARFAGLLERTARDGPGSTTEATHSTRGQ